MSILKRIKIKESCQQKITKTIFFCLVLSGNLIQSQEMVGKIESNTTSADPSNGSSSSSYFQLNIKSPGVTDFIKYGNIPIKSHTGAIDLSIPLISVGNNNQNPISVDLGYNSSGFMPAKRSGLVGLNWFLNVGGVISRQVKGYPDDYIGSPMSSTSMQPTNGFVVGVRNQYFPINDVFGFNPSTGFVHNSVEWMLGAYNANAYEGSPDIFEFNFNGISGKFFMGNDGQIKVITNEPNNLKVDMIGFVTQYEGNCVPYPSEIKIVDNQGNQYFFGGNKSNLEYSLFMGTDYSGRNPYNKKPIISSWFLSKIIYSNNSQIIFKYKDDTLNSNQYCLGKSTIDQTDKSFLSLNQYISEERNASFSQMCCVGLYESTSQTTAPVSYELQKKAILEKIEGDNFRIDFNYSSQLYKFNRTLSDSNFEFEDIKLDNISLNDKLNNVIKKIDFEYTYLGGVNNNRMFLNKITELGKTPYIFDYDITKNFPDPSTKGIDYWGFWNGLDSQNTLIPDMDYNVNGDYSYTSNTRSPSYDYSKQGLLKKIIYPTGGYTQFEYEPHQYGKRLERPRTNNFLLQLIDITDLAGGARIKKITDNDGARNMTSKDFSYVKNYDPLNPTNNTSSGVLLQWPRYGIHWTYNDGSLVYEVSKIRSNSINNAIYESSLITYSEVTESITGNGYTINKFSDYLSNPDSNDYVIRYNSTSINPYDFNPHELRKNEVGIFNNDRSVERGKLISKKTYNSSNNLIQENSFVYNNLLDRVNKFTTSIHKTGLWAQSNKLYFYNNYLTQEINKDYFGANQTTTINNYSYNPLTNNLIHKEAINSLDESLKTKYYYPSDSEMANESLVNELKDKKSGTILQTETWNGGEKLAVQKTEYAKDAYTSSLLLPKYNFSDKFPNLSPIGQLQKRFTYHLYDTKGNPIEVSNENGIHTVYIWGYDKTQPVAKIENITYSTIPVGLITAVENASSITGSESSLILSLNNLRNCLELSNAMVTTYTYKPLVGVSTITDSKGLTTYYTYDQFNRLKFIKDKDFNILQSYCYNYKGQAVDCSMAVITYYSSAKSGTYTRNNCGAGGVPSSVVYNLPAGAKSSTSSQADADARAQILIDTLGQLYANTSGVCTYKNVAASKAFNKSDCGFGKYGTSVVYSVVAGVYSSTISQADADAKAQQDIATNGQPYANTNGSCLFGNKMLKVTFTRNNCGGAFVGSSVVYYVYPGTYTSSISQAQVDAQAQADVNANGQNFANANGTCPIASQE